MEAPLNYCLAFTPISVHTIRMNCKERPLSGYVDNGLSVVFLSLEEFNTAWGRVEPIRRYTPNRGVSRLADAGYRVFVNPDTGHLLCAIAGIALDPERCPASCPEEAKAWAKRAVAYLSGPLPI